MAPGDEAIEVRSLAAEHAEAYVRARQRMLRDDTWAFGASPSDDLEGEARRVRDMLSSEGKAIVGAISIGAAADQLEVVATAGILRYEQPKRAHAATIWGVWTEPAHRGRGVGRRVMLEAIDVARRWPGVERIHLSVSERSPMARAFYESLGFRTWGVQPDGMRIGDESAAERFMQANIDDLGRP